MVRCLDAQSYHLRQVLLLLLYRYSGFPNVQLLMRRGRGALLSFAATHGRLSTWPLSGRQQEMMPRTSLLGGCFAVAGAEIGLRGLCNELAEGPVAVLDAWLGLLAGLRTMGVESKQGLVQ